VLAYYVAVKAIVLFRQTLQSTAYLNSRFIICLLG
jgi:hypothetical protein